MSYLTVLNLLLASALLPLVGFLTLLVWGRRLGRQGSGAGALAIIVAVASFGFSVAALMVWGAAQERNSQPNYMEAFTYRWIPIPAAPSHAPIGGPILLAPDAGGRGNHAVPASSTPEGLTVGCMIDSLTIVMFLVLTLLNLLAHLFALGTYARTAAARDRPRFFALLALLNFGVLGLLLSNALVQALIFWEITGLAAFFLLRRTLPETLAPRASLRMYFMNLLGSGAFLLGLGILILHTHSLARLAFFDDRGTSILSDSVRRALDVQSSEFLFFPGGEGFLQMHWLTWAGICFIVAALCRMAQFPFLTWLHEVAEAPAALVAIVAVTMLATGVFFLARLYPILTLDARLILAVVGVITLAAAAAVTLVETDIRKILAWSTISQGGYILLFLGTGAYSAGILHLLTHGFAKTALFLAAGIVVRGLGTADIRQMGGLWPRFPITAIGALLAVGALGGMPWLSGAYSTNLGLAGAYDYANRLQQVHGGHFVWLLFYLPLAMTFVTALALGRWWWLIFAGTNRAPKLIVEETHESAFLTMPIILLAAFYLGQLYDSSTILALIDKSIPTVLKASGHSPTLILADPSDGARKWVLQQAIWPCLGLAAAVLIYWRGTALAYRFRRLPGLNVVDFWLREHFFLGDLFEGVLVPALLLLPRLVQFIESVAAVVMNLVGALFHLILTGIAKAESRARDDFGPSSTLPHAGSDADPE
jgi:NADH-quinone oxidoreductase subunit L